MLCEIMCMFPHFVVDRSIGAKLFDEYDVGNDRVWTKKDATIFLTVVADLAYLSAHDINICGERE